MGLYLTISTQREDREHKELMIRPSLDMEVDESDFSIVLINKGLGPAVIKHVVYRLDDKCISPSKADLRYFISNSYSKTNYYIGHRFHSLLDSVQWRNDFKTSFGSNGGLPTPGQLIASGKDLLIYKVNAEFAAELHAKLWELGAATHRSFMDNFVTYAISVPIGIRYCSMSGVYCYASVQGTDDARCSLPN
jgi:hypothetical protein